MNVNFSWNDYSNFYPFENLVDDESDYDAESESEYDEYQELIQTSERKFSFPMNQNSSDWFIYHLVFPDDEDDYYYQLYYETKSGFFKNDDSYLILKIENNEKFLKELSLEEYDNYKWPNNEHPIVFNSIGYEK